MERRLETMPLDEILPTVLRNPKRHEDVRPSFDRFGFIELPTLDERTGRLVSGHGRIDSLNAAHAAGGEPPEGVTVGPDGRWMVPVVRGWSSVDDREAEAAGVAVNRYVEAGGWDFSGLSAVLTDVSTTAAKLEGIGYTADQLASMIAAIKPPEFKPGDQSAQPRLDVRTPIVCPNCGHHFHRS